MMEHVNWVKGTLTAAVAALTALWGWFGWVVLLFVVCMVGDYATGSAVAMRNGQWSSKAARDGIWHKAGSIVVVLVAGAADLLIGTMVSNLPGIKLPFEYTVLFCPIVVIWYILTECGSIIENAVGLGAPCPPWLAPIIEGAKDAVDAVGKKGGAE